MNVYRVYIKIKYIFYCVLIITLTFRFAYYNMLNVKLILE